MHAAVLTEPGSITIKDRETPKPRPNEVVVKNVEIGICGSDVHYYEHGQVGEFVVKEPLILGHESAGVVTAVGEDVGGLEVGDHVALEPGVPCRHCDYCRRGNYQLCPDVTFMATPPVDGAFVESVAWPADYAFKLPNDVSFREGAMAEPAAVGVHACRKGGVSGGDSVFVAGAGPIGLIAADVARAMGATTTVVSDIVASKLERAAERGADYTVDPTSESVPDAVREATDRDGADVVIEATGAPESLADAIDAVRPGGTVVVVGLGADPELSLDVADLVTRELTVQGSFRYSNAYPAAIGFLQRGDIDVESLVDFELPLKDVQKGLERAQEADVIKGMITIGN